MSARNRETLTRFYTAFAKLDHETMKECYHESATFRDEVFTLNGRDEIAGMWRMLCETTKEKGADVWKLEFKTSAGEGACTAHWEADYRFSATKRMVHNIIEGVFEFNAEGLIVKHVDTFNFYAWARQALGCTGYLLGCCSCFQNKVRGNAANNLARFRAKEASKGGKIDRDVAKEEINKK